MLPVVKTYGQLAVTLSQVVMIAVYCVQSARLDDSTHYDILEMQDSPSAYQSHHMPKLAGACFGLAGVRPAARRVCAHAW